MEEADETARLQRKLKAVATLLQRSTRRLTKATDNLEAGAQTLVETMVAVTGELEQALDLITRR